ncbi:uncharacterized protein MAM_03547 [Metarhizium album ARSEF 1941]|uniref:Hydrophobin n=1 Tax=Metarhizium album (strain ARSEF 1941) TaxID=1081103 RepID=A0A0B2WWI0_METAS|nr:uncharacterized protein MAM_03547 [Metarhizium album ARSEF 1941]KHN98423.1 hypothetical protein MAM_03547 [Metarhizium album ARSEF 1941]
MKYATAVVALAAVAVAAPVEVDKRNNTCPNTANVACCSIPIPILGNLLCNVVQPGGAAWAILTAAMIWA